jgi:hypothetical protein
MIGTSVRRAIGAGRVIACAVILLGCAQALSNTVVIAEAIRKLLGNLFELKAAREFSTVPRGTHLTNQ